MKIAHTIHYGYAYARAWTELRLIYMTRRTRRAMTIGGVSSIGLAVILGVFGAIAVPPTSATASLGRRKIARTSVTLPTTSPVQYHAPSTGPRAAASPEETASQPRPVTRVSATPRVLALASPPKLPPSIVQATPIVGTKRIEPERTPHAFISRAVRSLAVVNDDVVTVDAEPPKPLPTIATVDLAAGVAVRPPVIEVQIAVAQIPCVRSTKGDGPIRLLKGVLTATNLGASVNAVRGRAGAKILGLRSLPLFLVGVVGERIIARHEAVNACPAPDVEE